MPTISNPPLTTQALADLLGVPVWRVRRLADLLGSPLPRIGIYRLISPELAERIRIELTRRGLLPSPIEGKTHA